jgi:hypothetical protein
LLLIFVRRLMTDLQNVSALLPSRPFLFKFLQQFIPVGTSASYLQ